MPRAAQGLRTEPDDVPENLISGSPGTSPLAGSKPSGILQASPGLKPWAESSCPFGAKLTNDSLHECLVVFLGDGLVGNPDDTVDNFRVGFLFDHQISGINSLLTLANGILEHGVVQLALGH